MKTRRYVWEQNYTADQYIGLLETFSGHITIGNEKRQRLYDAIRELLAPRSPSLVRRHWLTILHVARRAMKT